MDYTKYFPSSISTCTGFLRGLERGIEAALEAKLRIAAFVEIETVVVENLLQGMEKGFLDPTPIWTNLKTFPYRPFHGKIFALTGGYPCQPFSVAGGRKGSKDPRHLWPYLLRIVQSVKPVCCFFENVEGHINYGFEEVSRDLRKMGYRVEAGIFSAEEIGASHQRKRLFILAIRNDVSQLKQFMVDSYGYGSSLHRPSEASGKDGPEGWQEGAPSLWISGTSTPAGGLSSDSSGFGKMANAGSKRHKRDEPDWLRGEGAFFPGSAAECGSTRFPARPNQPQYDWEATRLIEPGLGVTIDGYDFREDLIRGAGNGVVWQTAAFAFTTLLNKLS